MPDGLQIVFLIISAVTLASAVMVVSTRRVMHAALWLVLTLSGVAALFATLEASFFAVIQVAVYVGAIAILIIMTVMLTRNSMEDVGPQVNRNWPVVLVASLAVLAGLVFMLARWPLFETQARALPPGGENLVGLGKALVSPAGYVIPFEVASVLLVAALIGAILVAGEPKKK